MCAIRVGLCIKDGGVVLIFFFPPISMYVQVRAEDVGFSWVECKWGA